MKLSWRWKNGVGGMFRTVMSQGSDAPMVSSVVIIVIGMEMREVIRGILGWFLVY